MSTVSRGLPAQPHLDVPKQQARELLRQCQARSTDSLDRVRRRHPKFHAADDDLISSRLKLSDAQLVIAREYGFSSWTQLKLRITANTAAQRRLLLSRGLIRVISRQIRRAYRFKITFIVPKSIGDDVC